MAEEGSSTSRGARERPSFRDDTTPSVKDRKSLTGMSEKVKAALAPLLGGSKHYPEVEVDLGRESEAATYETVPMGSTRMTRFSTVAGTPEEPGASTTATTGADTVNDHHPRTSNGGDPSLVDKMKDTITGQAPGRGIYSGSTTTESISNDSDRFPTTLRGHIPAQDFGTGENSTPSAESAGEAQWVAGKHGPGHNPDEDKYVLDGTKDPVDRFSNTTTS